MCARYTVFTEEELIEMRLIIEEVSRKFGKDAVGTSEIRPTDTAPILTIEGGRLAPYPASWGFPKWDGKGVVLHARSETALQKPMFSAPLMSRRCVIPSTGFFEWTPESVFDQQLSLFPATNKPKSSEPKVKLYFRHPHEPMLYMAGMASTFMDKSGKEKEAFVILTAAANASVAPFHDRMPVILSPDECESWIRNEAFMRTVLSRLGPELAWEIAV